jgi:hypothetical protein
MDAIQVMMALFLNAMLACSAHPIEDRTLDHKPNPIQYQVMVYDCGDRQFEVWARACVNDDTHVRYQARPFLLAETHSHVGFYVNQFGEVLASATGGLLVNQVYVPLCGT